ncbi:SMAD/FHA domain-containing protein [Thamnocephalis sphaerospora]|uniref:SMAD/FHA domain-containing protein n=1 Tax=Thamnocephalis sphaerospora TaxID=78915 RepID=A0A4P9XXI8_9FUNG|nr:SMAD/FHA domain-containing protein [Thamnocephalis sphaerospora]|eukprot:RKP11105.1 SMAD/FHA domain-containing protein [Thamnocephalis sphaerospora]
MSRRRSQSPHARRASDQDGDERAVAHGGSRPERRQQRGRLREGDTAQPPPRWGGDALLDAEKRDTDDATAEEEAPKEKPNFGLSGKLAADTNMHNGVVVKYSEPSEARKPTARWRLYVFKNDDHLDLLHIHRQSAYLLGKDRRIADIPIDHPSCSKQHAVIQFRLMTEQTPVGQVGEPPKRVIKPFIIDLESTNGTFVNDERIPASRYYELRPKDTLRFGCSTREYVLLREEDARSESKSAVAAKSPTVAAVSSKELKA